jgi:hypothetical protein
MIKATSAGEPEPLSFLQQQQQKHSYNDKVRNNVTTSPTTSTSTNDRPQQQQIEEPQKSLRRVTILVRLRGEMSNLLSQWVFAKGIQWWMQEHHLHEVLKVELIGERQAGTKWKGAIHDLHMCFPNLRSLDYQGGKWDPTFQQIRQQQKAWLAAVGVAPGVIVIQGGDSDCGRDDELFCLHEKMAQLQSLWNNNQNQMTRPPRRIVDNNNMTTTTSDNHNRYSLPFLVTNQLASFDVLVDQYYNRIREWLQFDYDACCNSMEQPHADEVVFVSKNEKE